MFPALIVMMQAGFFFATMVRFCYLGADKIDIIVIHTAVSNTIPEWYSKFVLQM